MTDLTELSYEDLRSFTKEHIISTFTKIIDYELDKLRNARDINPNPLEFIRTLAVIDALEILKKLPTRLFLEMEYEAEIWNSH